jgi:hypothetical protein
MTPEERAELEELRREVHRLTAQVRSLRSALVISCNAESDLLVLADETNPGKRLRARTGVLDSLSEIGRHLSGASFEGEKPKRGRWW